MKINNRTGQQKFAKKTKESYGSYMILYDKSLSLYEQPRRGICHKRQEHRSCKFFWGTGKIFKIPNQFLEIRDLLYTKLLQAGKKTFIKKKKQSHLITKCFATNWIPPVSKLQSKKDLLHPYAYLDWWERHVCNDFSFKQIVCPIAN